VGGSHKKEGLSNRGGVPGVPGEEIWSKSKSKPPACARKLRRALLEVAGPAPQLDFLETHPLIRSLDAYQHCVPDCFVPSTINQ
jgi:hypothetical protein